MAISELIQQGCSQQMLAAGVLSLQVSVPRSRAPLRVQNLRVNNVEIPNSKRVEISLQYIYGIGSTTAKEILVNTVRTDGWMKQHGSGSDQQLT
jgi:hypothetical protein